jgi:glycosyltransferase involved in cell wall biosynthesis
VRLFLDSVSRQSYKSFELIFVNQGSDEAVNEWLVPLLSTFPFVRYYYSDTRGQFFNKSNALNIGIKSAFGEFIVIADIDIVLPIEFLEKANRKITTDIFLTHSAYYLPEKFCVNAIEDIYDCGASVAVYERFIGLCVASRKAFQEINGYDEYYLFWGGEDDDIIFRMEKSGIKRQHIPAKEAPVYHQWHSSHAPDHPTPWYLETINYLYLESKSTLPKNSIGHLIETSQRILLEKIDQKSEFKSFELFGNSSLQFNLFVIGFEEMKSGEFGQFEFPIRPLAQIPMGRKQKVIDKVNILLQKFNFPYSIEKNGSLERNLNLISEKNARERWKEFILFFVGKNRNLFADYYLIDSEERLVLFFEKK